MNSSNTYTDIIFSDGDHTYALGWDHEYQTMKNTMHDDDVIVFQGQMIAIKSISELQREINTFQSPVKELLLWCMSIGLVSPIPGGTLALSIPTIIIWWKHRKKIIDILI